MNLAAYAGRWVALVGEQVAGVGQTAVQAIELAQRNRPKDRITLRYVEAAGGELLNLSPLLAQLRPFFLQQALPIYLVGGAVRDALLNKPSHDLDFVVPQGGIRLARRVGNFLGAPAYPLDEKRDTGRVVLEEAGTVLDFACFRGADLMADLGDRDFTINAIAMPATAVLATSLIDPCGGVADLAAGRLRPTHAQAIANDPVRTLRGVRMGLKFGLTIDTETATLLQASASALSRISNERIRDELVKLLQTAVPDQALAHLDRYSLLPQVLPEISALATVDQSPPHFEPVLAHTIRVLRWLREVELLLTADTSPTSELTDLQAQLRPFAPALAAHLARPVDREIDGRTLLRLGAVFHDVGKRETQTTDENGRFRFFGHDKVGAKLAAARLHELAFSNKVTTYVRDIVAHHMRPLMLTQTPETTLSGRTIHRYFRATAAAGLDIGLLALADHLATYNGRGKPETWAKLLLHVVQLFDHFFNRYEKTVAPTPLLNGNELMQMLRLPPGPEIGRLLRLIAEAQAAGEIHTAAEALQFASRSRQ